MAEFLGLIAADGHVHSSDTSWHIDFANHDEGLRFRMTQLWSKLFLGTATASVATPSAGVVSAAVTQNAR